MAGTSRQSLAGLVWTLARAQHGLVARRQLTAAGASRAWIEHRLATGRLHRVRRGVYVVGRPELGREGRWMAAVLACGSDAYLSHASAAALWGVLPPRPGAIHVSLRAGGARPSPGIRVHRRPGLPDGDLTIHRGIPATTPVRTLLDLAAAVAPNVLEAAVNEADTRDLIDPETLREELGRRGGQTGVRALRALLDRHTYRLTESELERRFLRIVRSAGLPLPETQVELAGRVDFHWPELGLVVETDGLRYHRTPARQARDNRRMQGHAAAGRTAVRFAHFEIRHEPRRVEAVLKRLVEARRARKAA